MKPKPTLSEFQSAISRAIMTPLGSGESMRSGNRPTADALVKPNDRLTSFERLQIYNQQYWWRLLGSIADDFSGLQAVLGVRRFERLAVAYLTDCGSTSWNLGVLGKGLSAYIAEHPDLVGPFAELAFEVASIEWARTVAFDGEPLPLLDPVEFAARSPERMTLRVQPYITLLELDFPVDKMRLRMTRSENAAASNAVSGHGQARRKRITAKRLAQPVHLAVHRLDLRVYYKRLEPEAYRLLMALGEGMPLEQACGKAFQGSLSSLGALQEKVRGWFGSWMAFGWLCDAASPAP